MLTIDYYMHLQVLVSLALLVVYQLLEQHLLLWDYQSLHQSLGIVSTVSTCVGGILLLSSKKYKKKLLKCYELSDKITSSLATFEVLFSLSLNDGTVIDAKEFHKLQTLYLQLMAHVRNIDRKMKVQTEESFQKNYNGRNK